MADRYMQIENIVFYIILDYEIPLKKLVKGAETSDVPGIIYKINEPQAAAVIFSSGKIVCTGTKTMGTAQKAMDKITEKLKSKGIEVPNNVLMKVESITAVAKIEANLDLEEIAHSLQHCRYNPELSALVCQIEETGASLLVYSSGKILCTKAKSIEAIHKSLEILKKDLESAGVRVKQLLMS